jgi:hypothetical protein
LNMKVGLDFGPRLRFGKEEEWKNDEVAWEHEVHEDLFYYIKSNKQKE